MVELYPDGTSNWFVSLRRTDARPLRQRSAKIWRHNRTNATGFLAGYPGFRSSWHRVTIEDGTVRWNRCPAPKRKKLDGVQRPLWPGLAPTAIARAQHHPRFFRGEQVTFVGISTSRRC